MDGQVAFTTFAAASTSWMLTYKKARKLTFIPQDESDKYRHTCVYADEVYVGDIYRVPLMDHTIRLEKP